MKFRENTYDSSSEFVSDRTAAEMLQVEYLGETDQEPKFPVKGEVIGFLNRSYVNLITKYKDKKEINVIFMIDTGFISFIF